MSGDHALLAPSSLHRRSRCPGSLAACKGIPNETNEYAAEGTVYHQVAADTLVGLSGQRTPQADCLAAVGRMVESDGFKFTIDAENAAYAQVYVDAIRRIPGTLLVEMRLDTSTVAGVDGQGGTGDAIVLDYEHATIHVNDLKFGRGEVVFAPGNEQMLTYGAAALEMFQDLCDWQYVKVAIHQPRVGHYDEWLYSVREVRDWAHGIRPGEQRAYQLWLSGSKAEIRAALSPGEKQCRWCPIKGSCAARSEAMLAQFPVTPAPVNIEMTDAECAAARDRVDDIADWCSAVQAETLRRALAGKSLPGWKLVVGRKGARKWIDESGVEQPLFDALGGKAYQPAKIITAAVAEKLLKVQPAVWSALQPQIAQADGAPSLVKESDPREVLSVATVEFGLVAS